MGGSRAFLLALLRLVTLPLLFWALFTRPDKKGGGWKEEEFFAEGERAVEHHMKAVEGQVPRLAREKALDFGCGAGRLTLALGRRFREVHGVDVSPNMIAHAERFNRYPGKCVYHVNPASDLRIFRADDFDLVLSILTLQHVGPDLQKAYLREFIRVLKPGGAIYLQLPSCERETGRLVHRTIREGDSSAVGQEPFMDMHGEDPSTSSSLAKEAKGKVLWVDTVETPICRSHFYTITKERPEETAGFPFEILG